MIRWWYSLVLLRFSTCSVLGSSRLLCCEILLSCMLVTDWFVRCWLLARPSEWIYSTDSKNWFEAEADCRKQGGHHVAIHAEKEEDALTTFWQSLTTSTQFWIGGTDLTTAVRQPCRELLLACVPINTLKCLHTGVELFATGVHRGCLFKQGKGWQKYFLRSRLRCWSEQFCFCIQEACTYVRVWVRHNASFRI